MAKLLIQTQVFENYGAHAWNGEGDCPQYWKAKGGEDYVIANINPSANLADLVNAVKPQIECNDTAYRENIISWEVIGDSDLTPFEADQMEFDGKIEYPTRVLTLPETEYAA